MSINKYLSRKINCASAVKTSRHVLYYRSFSSVQLIISSQIIVKFNCYKYSNKIIKYYNNICIFTKVAIITQLK